jgi:hypothetical protein
MGFVRCLCLGGFALALAAIASCTPTQVAINARFPANYPQAAELRRVAVAEFDGRGGREFTGVLRSQLASAVFDGQRHFNLIEGVSSPNAQAARQLDAEAVVYGSVSIDRAQQGYAEGRRECVAVDDDNDCIRWQDYEVACTAVTLSVAANPNLLRAGDSSIIYSTQKRAERTSRWCSDGRRNTSDDAMIADMFDTIAREIRRDIAPYNSVLNATISESSQGLPRNLAAQFDQAVEAAKAANVAGACDSWRAVDGAQPDHVWTVYNLGICAEATGDYAGALARYQRASELGGASNRAVADSIARVNRLMGAEQQLAAEEASRRAAAEAEAERVAAAARQAEAARNARRADLTARYGAAAANAILAGQVQQGMTPQQVIEARGQPGRREEVTPTDHVWHYGSERVFFSDGRVTYVRR